MSFLSDYTEKNSNLIPQIDIPCFAWNSQAEQGFLFFKAKSLRSYLFVFIRIDSREFDTLKSKKVPQSLEIGLFFCQIFIFII